MSRRRGNTLGSSPFPSPNMTTIGTGYWSPITANVDWCENNYAVSFYIAEFWNTLSSLVPLAFLPMLGMWSCWRQHAEWRIILSHASLFIVGIGSTLFHGTLHRWAQLLDELPMIYGSLVFIFAILDTPSKTRQERSTLYAVLTAYGILVSVLVWWNPDSQIEHQVCYALEVLVLVVQSSRIRASTEDANLHWLFKTSLVAYGSGFGCWLLDKHFCAYVEWWKLHAVWHAGSGYGTFLFIQFAHYWRLKECKWRPKLSILWGCVPMIASH